MTLGDGGPGAGVVPVPRGSADLPGRARPTDLVTTNSPSVARNRSTTAVLEVVAPPWLRVPDGASDVPAPSRPPRPRAVDAPRPASEMPPGPARPGVAPVAPRPAPTHPARARPPVVPEPGIVGLSRMTRSRVGSRLFTLFFVAVFAVIFVQMLMAILYGSV